MTKPNPFRYFKSSPKISRLAVTLYVRYLLSLRNVEVQLHERGIEISHETRRSPPCLGDGQTSILLRCDEGHWKCCKT